MLALLKQQENKFCIKSGSGGGFSKTFEALTSDVKLPSIKKRSPEGLEFGNLEDLPIL